MYHPTKFGCKKISSSVDMLETVIFDHMSPIVLTLKIANQWHAGPWWYTLYQVWLQKVQLSRRDHPDEHLLKFWTFAVTLTLNTINSYKYNLFKRQSSICNQMRVGCKKDQQFRRQSKSYNLTTWSLHCDLYLEDSKPVFSLWLMIMHHNTKFGKNIFSRSEDTLWTLTDILKFYYNLDIEHSNIYIF